MDALGPWQEIAATWRQKAEELRHWGAPRQADTLESAAEYLEQRGRAWRLEELSTAQAAELSGYSEKHLRRLASEGKLPASKVRGELRFRRCDLPRKPAGEREAVQEAVRERKPGDRIAEHILGR